MIHINNLPTTDEAVFAGKKRTFHIACQGQFKRPVKCVAAAGDGAGGCSPVDGAASRGCRRAFQSSNAPPQRQTADARAQTPFPHTHLDTTTNLTPPPPPHTHTPPPG